MIHKKEVLLFGRRLGSDYICTQSSDAKELESF